MQLFIVLAFVASTVSAFRQSLISRPLIARKANGVRSMTAVLDVFAGLAVANALNNNSPMMTRTSLPVAVIETKQGMYKEYTIDTVDDSNLDEIRRGYKTAEETDDNKNKYWAILAVLLAGSFVIPMVQYYWYVAEED